MQTDTMNRDMQQLEEKALAGLHEARGAVESYARENPRTAVALALGVGFVLGGGLTPRVLFGLGALAARVYLRRELGAYASGLRGEMSEGTRADAE